MVELEGADHVPEMGVVRVVEGEAAKASEDRELVGQTRPRYHCTGIQEREIGINCAT